MDAQTLIEDLKAEGIISSPRERTDWMWWLGDRSARFLSFKGDKVTLWQSNMPRRPNDQLESLPMEQATVETVAALIT